MIKKGQWWLKPFFCYFGGKWRIALKYPPPRHKTIIEPFAGAAGYSTRWWNRQVILCDLNEQVVGTWQYLIRSSASDILALPSKVDDVRDLKVCQEAKYLIGWWMQSGRNSIRFHKVPKARPCPNSLWGSIIRDRIAKQITKIQHWKVTLGSWQTVTERYRASNALWFVDPPYQHIIGGLSYTHNSSNINYEELSTWCRSRQDQVIVCESDAADWLPFRPFLNGVNGDTKGGVTVRTNEVIWTNEIRR